MFLSRNWQNLFRKRTGNIYWLLKIFTPFDVVIPIQQMCPKQIIQILVFSVFNQRSGNNLSFTITDLDQRTKILILRLKKKISTTAKTGCLKALDQITNQAKTGRVCPACCSRPFQTLCRTTKSVIRIATPGD